MYDSQTRETAARLRASGLTISEVARTLRVSRSTLRSWESEGREPDASDSCPASAGTKLDQPAYAALLGFYLGDGCLSSSGSSFVLRISCDSRFAHVIDDVVRCLQMVRAGNVSHVSAPGCTVVQARWKHWPCLFPQHGPGRKHERPIVLEAWQRCVVEQHPADFLRGLFHSDGSRVRNWARRPVAGTLKRYEYPRWQFSNTSADILELCCWALDLVEIPWRRSSVKHVSVSRRNAVARLDDLIGPKC